MSNIKFYRYFCGILNGFFFISQLYKNYFNFSFEYPFQKKNQF